MKTLKIKTAAFFVVFTFAFESCKQDVITLQQPPGPPTPETPSKGNADFTKFIAIGNSFVAGVQSGALFTEGQNNSLPAIMATQFAVSGVDGGAFTQPTIGASLGYNLFVSPNPGSNNKVIGRLLLQYGTNVSCATGNPSPLPTAQEYALGNLEAVPNPSVNPGFIFGNGSEKATLNNFGIPAITLGQALTSATGDWSNPDPAAGFSPFYARLAYPGTGSKIISDAAAAGGSFFLFWLGLDDFFLYAAFGGDPTKAPLTSSGTFTAYYNAALSPTTGLLASNPNLKGVVGNFPEIFAMPHFTAVTYNPIPLDAATAGALTTGFAGYNGVLDAIIGNAGLLTNFGLSASDLTRRKVSFSESCNNKILLNDETLTDLGPVFDYLRSINAIDSDAKRAALVPYQKTRQTTAEDIIPLSTGSILGKPGSFGALGVSEPVGDRWVIIPSERDEIIAARTAYNTSIANFVAANSTRLALADVNSAMSTLVTYKAAVMNGVTITPNIDPPTGIYSEDGVHPNSRGYAYLSTIFISAINSTFSAKVPLTDISLYGATALPIP